VLSSFADFVRNVYGSNNPHFMREESIMLLNTLLAGKSNNDTFSKLAMD